MTAERRPLLEAVDVVQEFPSRGPARGRFRAVSRVSFEVRSGETLGIVGESGSGKTSLARAVLQIPRPTSGSVLFRGVDLTGLRGQRLREQRRTMQMVFQEPFSSVNRKWRVFDIVEEPLIGYGLRDRGARRRRVEEVLDLVALSPGKFGKRRPVQLSGGQCQRVAIARALVCHPELVVCDEAVSALDVLTQVQVLDLFRRLRRELDLSYLFISHDLAVVKYVSDRVAVMYMGEVCEIGSTESVFQQPRHPYTAALLASIPSASAEQRRFTGLHSEPVPPAVNSRGCRFVTRCASAQPRCTLESPVLRRVGDEHFVACHFPAATVVNASGFHAVRAHADGDALRVATAPTSSTPAAPSAATG